MTENPYAIPLEELVRRTWVPAGEQVVGQPEPGLGVGPGGSGDGGASCDGADGDG
jgi:hypothetical protein